MSEPKRYRAGQTIDDLCRACKEERLHTVIVADGEGRPMRVTCDFCGSEHNYRGGGVSGSASSAGSRAEVASSSAVGAPGAGSSISSIGVLAVRREAPAATEPFPLVSDRERSLPVVSPTSTSADGVDLELLLRRVIREETGLTPVAPAAKWRGGQLVLRPGKADLQEKSWPIETFFHKIVMLRNRLRTLEQQVNSTELPEDTKVRLQAYITGCYGSLTSFNVLFAEDDDQFKGSGSGE